MSCGRVLCGGQGGSARRALQLTEINLIEMQRHLKFDVVELEGSIYMLHTHTYTRMLSSGSCPESRLKRGELNENS